MSKISDLSSNNPAGQLSNANLATSQNAAKSALAENQGNLQTDELESLNTEPDVLMAASSLINSTIQLRNDLSRKLDGNNRANKTGDQSDDERPERKNNSSSRHSKRISLNLSESTTALQSIKVGLRKYAAEAGLPPGAQDDFVEEHAQKFVTQAENEGFGSLLEKTGDFSLLKPDSPSSQKLNSEIQLLSTEIEADSSQAQSLPNISDESYSDFSPADNAVASFRPEESLNQATNFELLTNNDQPRNLEQAPNSRPASNSSQTLNLNQAGLVSDDYSAVAGFNNSVSQRATIEARFPAPIQTPREFETLTAAIQKKIEEVLQKLGLGSEEKEGNILGAAKSAKDLHLVSEFLGAQKPREAKDKALFATAFGVATEASGKSRERHGDGVLLEFANYGDKAPAAGKEANQLALAKLLQHGTQAGYPALLKSVDSYFSSTELKSVEQIKEKLGADKTSTLVVGVVTMSVMSREVVEQLNHVTVNSSLGLSDNALAALQKAHNSLRDHLTPNDVIGAVGNLKNTHIEIEGVRYNFLPEVNEALNSLREARSRILSETMSLKPDAGGTDAQHRLALEAENLFGITERIESILGV